METFIRHSSKQSAERKQKKKRKKKQNLTAINLNDAIESLHINFDVTLNAST